MNLGISKATGSKLLILHGDNLLSDNGAKLIEDNFLNQTIQFGCSTIFNDNTNSFLFVKLEFST